MAAIKIGKIYCIVKHLYHRPYTTCIYKAYDLYAYKTSITTYFSVYFFIV